MFCPKLGEKIKKKTKSRRSRTCHCQISNLKLIHWTITACFLGKSEAKIFLTWICVKFLKTAVTRRTDVFRKIGKMENDPHSNIYRTASAVFSNSGVSWRCSLLEHFSYTRCCCTYRTPHFRTNLQKVPVGPFKASLLRLRPAPKAWGAFTAVEFEMSKIHGNIFFFTFCFICVSWLFFTKGTTKISK